MNTSSASPVKRQIVTPKVLVKQEKRKLEHEDSQQKPRLLDFNTGNYDKVAKVGLSFPLLVRIVIILIKPILIFMSFNKSWNSRDSIFYIIQIFIIPKIPMWQLFLKWPNHNKQLLYNKLSARSETVLNICKHSQERVCKKNSDTATSQNNHYIEPDKWKHDNNGYSIFLIFCCIKRSYVRTEISWPLKHKCVLISHPTLSS